MNFRKQFYNKFSIILALAAIFAVLPASAAAQDGEMVPLATRFYLLGGSQNGKWLTAEAVAPTISKRTAMVFVSLNGAAKKGAILSSTGEDYGACPENKLMRLEPETASGFAVGANAGWNLVPRAPQSLSTTNKAYLKIAADFLRSKGIARTKINLNQIVRIDLEGDGRAEVLMTGNFYRKGVMEAQTPGDYSFALLRKIVNGRAQNILIAGEFFTRRDYYDPPNTREILAVADLNGDGRMEIVLDTHYYEGSWKQVFEINGTRVSKVLEASCLV